MWCIIFWCLFLTLSSIFSWIFLLTKASCLQIPTRLRCPVAKFHLSGPRFGQRTVTARGCVHRLWRSFVLRSLSPSSSALSSRASSWSSSRRSLSSFPFTFVVVLFTVLLSSSLRRSALRLHFFCPLLLCRTVHSHFLFISFVVVACIIRAFSPSSLSLCLSPTSNNRS